MLFWTTLIAYCSLVVFTVLRSMWFWQAVWTDLTDPKLVFSFFTIVAGTDVLGVGLSVRGLDTIALVLWLVALAAWVALIYFSFGVMTISNAPQRADIVHGGWLLAIVGAESLVVLGTAVAPALSHFSPTAFVLLHMLWGIGLGLYGIFIAIFSHRMLFLDVALDDITPSLWIVMGAAAISANAGSDLILGGSAIPFLRSMRPFIDGMTLIMWAWGTWWVPLLLLLGIWKHAVCREPLTYTPMLWSLVFPLGMYSLASLRLSLVADFLPLQLLSHAMAWIALVAWMTTAAGLCAATWRSFCLFKQERSS